MPKESERKFLVQGDAWRSLAAQAHSIRQFYLAAGPDRSVRVRIKGGKAELTLKFGTAVRERDEFEYSIPIEEAKEMEPFAIGSVIEKTRHLVHHGGYLYEVDEFSGTHGGLVIAELETEREVAHADLPSWLSREVTGVRAYYNSSLARHGLPENEQPGQ